MTATKYSLDGAQVSPDAALWCNSPHLPKMPALQQITAACDPLKAIHPIPQDPTNEISELIELSQIRDDPTKISSITLGRERLPISSFLQIRPQPVGAHYNLDTANTAPVIQNGAELSRWFESETPGLGHRLALNFLLPKTNLTPPQQARIWAALDLCTYAAILAAWHYKWTDPQTANRPRPVEVKNDLDILFNFEIGANGHGKGMQRVSPQPSPGTPRHPSYPSGHSTVGGAASELLSYFFPDQREDFDRLADNAGMARLWAGIHYRSDHTFGMAVGRAVAKLITSELAQDGANPNPGSDGANIFGDRPSLY
jgi:hypothetical protein